MITPQLIARLTLVASLCLTIAESQADVVYLADGQTLFGRVRSQQADSVTFDQRIDGASEYRLRTVARADITALVINISPTRLAQLNPTAPAGYRDLAEELAWQKRDPEALELAIRLFLVAAAHGDPELQSGCFAGLISLARSLDEEKRFRALAHVTLAGHREWLTNVSDTRPGQDSRTAEQKQNRTRLLKSLVDLRTGKRAEAATAISQPWAQQAMRPFHSICTWDQLRAWSINAELKTEWLARTLELEIALANSAWATDRHDPASNDWSQMVDQTTGNLEPVSFDNVTEFDLTRVYFRDGKWIAADVDTKN